MYFRNYYKFINKILRNQIQYRYISTQVVMLSDIDGDCQLTLPLACLVSALRLIFILILQVRESPSTFTINVHKSELVPDYSLLLLTALMHLMRTFIEESLPLTCNLSHDAQKHVRFVIVP